MKGKATSFGRWIVVGSHALASGGNGSVWLVRQGEFQAVVKAPIPRSRGAGDRLARFMSEIDFLCKNPSEPGIVPIINYSIDPKYLWYAMPRVETLREALGEEPDLGTVIEAYAAYSATLTRLASRRISHRDIKPNNLFRQEGRWLIGDFGLVSYPDKDPATRNGRRLGPIDYLAPEMRINPDGVDGCPADVYSLAKSLWASLIGDPHPLPGPHAANDEKSSLASRIIYPWVRELDNLIEQCTRNDPRARPPMSEVATELAAMLESPPEHRESPSLEEIGRRLQSLFTSYERRTEQAQEFVMKIGRFVGELENNIVLPIVEDIQRAIGSNRGTGSPLTAVWSHLEIPERHQSPFRENSIEWSFPGPDQELRPTLKLAAGLRVIDESGRSIVGAVLWVERENVPIDPADYLYKFRENVRLDTAAMQASFLRIKVEARNQLVPALVKFASWINPSSSTD